MDLTFNQIEAVFMQRFDIPDSRAVAFRGRLQHLQRLKFPDGVNTGRGTRASYGWMQTIQLMVTLDLIDLGMTPEVAVRSVRQGRDRLFVAICQLVSDFETTVSLVKALKKARCPFGITQMAVVSAYALTLPQGGAGSAVLLTFTGRKFTELLNDDPAIEPAAAYINLGSRMMLVGQLVGKVAALETTEVAIDLRQWAIHWVDQDRLS